MLKKKREKTNGKQTAANVRRPSGLLPLKDKLSHFFLSLSAEVIKLWQLPNLFSSRWRRWEEREGVRLAF